MLTEQYPDTSILQLIKVFLIELLKRKPEHGKAVIRLGSDINSFCRRGIKSSNRKPQYPVFISDQKRLNRNEQKVIENLGIPFLNVEAAVYLIGSVILIRYETDAKLLRSFISFYMMDIDGIEGWEITSIVQRFFTENPSKNNQPLINRSQKSEIYHVRNSIAHSHINFLKDGKVELWIEKKRDW